ncbi:Na+/H+ antiporter NhaC family protein, partial [Candidatus Parcubacteria bacterium]|nr:Na+/H+ antiporter NhaC family protein [Candidatus Parcubacteria bacterium]
PFSIFIESIPYRFYPILALILTLMVSVMGRDFGSMLKAERRARTTGKLIRDGATPASDLTDLGTVTAGKDIPRRWINGVFPIVTLIAITLIGLYVTGKDAIIAAGGSDFSLRIVLANASSFTALFWASLSACVLAIAMTLVQRILPLADIMDAWLHGAKSMVLALVILVLAWSIGYVTKELKTAEYIVQILQHSLSPHWLPVLTFIVAAAISFAIGTSWATMAILMPITVPLAWALVQSYGLDAASSQLLLYGSVSSVLAGSVWGDHCSPISDTTVMSSMASACDHIDHVKTQMPYAIFVAIVGMLVGDIPTAYGFSPYLSIIIAIGIFYLFLRFVGKKVDI